MSTCDNSKIRNNYIVQTASEFDVLSACTGVYTNNLYSCTGDTVYINDNVSTNIVYANVFSGGTYYGDGSNLSGISTDNFYTTGVTLQNDILYFDRTDTLSAYTVSLLPIVFSGGSGSCITDLYVSNIFGCSPITIHDNIEPSDDGLIDLGIPLKRFREINTLSGNSSVWTSTISVNTPNLNLGVDLSGNTRIITANNSILQNDILNGGSY
jgi:hypothetical protein